MTAESASNEINASAAAEGALPAPRRRAWTVAMLATIAFLAAIDRQSFSILLVPIQNDLHVSDAAMGLLSGSAFALVYAFVALPLARLADTTSRTNLISMAVGVWSAATALCGIVTGFWPLLLARIGVGSGEAALAPATMSLVGDLAPAHRRGTIIAINNVGAAIGFATAGVIAGFLTEHFGWKAAMMVVGLPGLALAALIYLTVPEPRRGLQDGARAGGAPAAAPLTFMQALRRCGQIRTLYSFVPAFVFVNICFQGYLIWLPAFLQRVHHLSPTKMGLVFGLLILTSTVVNVFAGPISDHFSKRGARFRVYYCSIAALVSAPMLAIAALAPTLWMSVVFIFIFNICSGPISVVAAATYLGMAPAHIRATLTAIISVVALGLGGGSAPVLFGLANDFLKPEFGDQSLRYTLLLAPLAIAIGGALFFLGTRTIEADVERASRDSGA